MRKSKLLGTIGLSLAFGLMSAGSTFAQTPDAVLTPYKAYRAALDQQDRSAALKHAEAAYDAAMARQEEVASLIAPLAQNYADLAEDTEERIELYKVSIGASPTGTQEERARVAERWVLLVQTQMLRDHNNRKSFKSARRDIDAAWSFIQENSLADTTFGAEVMVAKGWAAAGQGKEDTALEWYDRADAVFSSPNHSYFSVLEYTNKLLRGKTLLAYDRDIEAALSLQDVMQNNEGKLPAEHPYIQDAFQSWIWARSKIESSGEVSSAEEAGVCKCWPYDEMSADAPVPLVRVPPQMPRYAKRSGRVMIKFDVSVDGRPENVTVLGYTDKTFVKPSLKSLEKWRYEISDELPEADRKGIATTISFRLANERGALIPDDTMKMVETAPL